MPTSCPRDPHTGQPESLLTTLQADSWAEPHPAHPTEAPLFAEYAMAGLENCNRLQFSPEIRVTPDAEEASKPTGLNVDVHVPQTSVLNAEGLAESAAKDITVALPPGVAINPAGGNGLQACSESLAGFTGLSAPSDVALFTAMFPEPLQPGVNFCPDASKIGEVTIHSPLLPASQPLQGFVYLATQNQNPFGSLIALYLVVKDPISGTVVKLTGETRLCESAGQTIDGMSCQAAGQVIATFLNNPQLAFEDAELHFFGGERAPLTSPARCDPYTTTAAFVPWSSEPGEAPRTATSTFNVTSGPNGSSCPGPKLPFAPALHASAGSAQAGTFAPFSATISRVDGQQDMRSVQVHLPAGLEGLLTGVKLCPEPQANEGRCDPESLVGETTVSAGVGSDPVTVTGGKVYLTGKYAGAPFGLSIVNPVKAGPFDLEHDTANPAQNPVCDCVVVRAKIEIDPRTAALTVTTDGSGLHTIPTFIDGVPVQIQKVNVTINRPSFTFNPTSCEPMSVTGMLAGDEGALAPLSVPFQAVNCASLKFAPKFSVSTSGRTSKARGASLSVKLVYPKAPFGSQANIARVKVDLPKRLPSRLTTLQKACTAAQFKSNPAGCPAASLVGHAKAITPLIPVPLEGPAYFVSNGGEAFPNLIMVLQGYGVRIDIVGDTFISKAGITSNTFKAVPDAPVGSFELTLPQGRYSALTANGNLCKVKGGLKMPTEFVAQNGLKIKRSTKIAVTGCKVPPRTRLAAALRACHHKHGARRRACERAARRAYGTRAKRSHGHGR
jgi:hypothetical protein